MRWFFLLFAMAVNAGASTLMKIGSKWAEKHPLGASLVQEGTPRDGQEPRQQWRPPEVARSSPVHLAERNLHQILGLVPVTREA